MRLRDRPLIAQSSPARPSKTSHLTAPGAQWYGLAMLGPLETALLAILLIVLMFGMGATLTPERFREVAREPKAVLIGLASQFGWMPLLAFLLAKGFAL